MTNSERVNLLGTTATGIRRQLEIYNEREAEHKRIRLSPLPQAGDLNTSAISLLRRLADKGVLESIEWAPPVEALRVTENFWWFCHVLFDNRKVFNIGENEWDSNVTGGHGELELTILFGCPMVAGVLEREAGKIAGQADQPAAAAVAGEPASHRVGRLTRASSEAKKAELLAKCSAHPTLMNDIPALAQSVDVSESSCRRWLSKFKEKHAENQKE
jgi:hypothetical protein